MKNVNESNVLSIATFNVQWFGKRVKDYEALFSEIKGFDVIGVEEVCDTGLFRTKAAEYLGDSWHFATAGYPAQKVGFLFDSLKVKPIRFKTYDQLNIDRKNRPGYLGKFKCIETGTSFEVIVVHLKSGKRRKDERVRKKQWRELAAIVKTIKGSEKNMVLVGDMNCFDKHGENLTDLQTFIHRTGFVLVTDGRDFTTTVKYSAKEIDDHILVSPMFAQRLKGVSVGGACRLAKRIHRRERRAYWRNVSDHCPVTAAFNI
jgi:endonuclease/exonuclease/phosphatase family metal-dependent hydrolase